jgi:transcriptional regulator GlxA family with amidase domain
MRTEILIYDHFAELDALGPYDVLVRSGFDVALVTAEPTDRIVASVCTGAFLLAAGGLLDGRPATTHHDDFDDLEGTAAPVIRDARVVDDGDIITAAGVTSGIDMALWLAEKHMGAAVADRVAKSIEHHRDTNVWRATEAH